MMNRRRSNNVEAQCVNPMFANDIKCGENKKAVIMRAAWDLAKRAAKQFGGKAKEFFAESLKQAWAVLGKTEKTDNSYFINLQIKAGLRKA
ncbi:hypothetical protein AABD69_09050 [Edwardsiella piscicida]|uniref:hypothetical protein n=1 Tax=Edwardsiella piscicida TaxID=1263550 RepID=UPI001C63C08F|nr:hypothetical protein [Edwardsiella piscicida]UCQ29745.1 hypothetical protein DCF74_09555 [Edwardsiella piscicida]